MGKKGRGVLRLFRFSFSIRTSARYRNKNTFLPFSVMLTAINAAEQNGVSLLQGFFLSGKAALFFAATGVFSSPFLVKCNSL
jgi:hypothetical protein